MRSRLTAVLTSSLLCVLLLGTPAQAAFPGENGLIAFSRGSDFLNNDIHVRSADGSLSQRLTFTGTDTDPAWSADGQHIAFTRKREGNGEIYVMDADGANQTRLTADSADDAEPAWSPDGRRIVFQRVVDNLFEIFLVNLDGSGLANVTKGQGGLEPDWSPDGRTIAFISGNNVFVMNPDGTGRRQLTNYPPPSRDSFRAPGNPDWSPDGSRITYDLAWGGGTHFLNSIVVMTADGSNQVEHFFGEAAVVIGPAFSPDGTEVVFECNDGLCLLPPAGSPLPELLPGSTFRDFHPDWQPIVPDTGPQRSDYRNAAKFCKAEREFLGEEWFGQKYGSGASAYGKCVSGK